MLRYFYTGKPNLLSQVGRLNEGYEQIMLFTMMCYCVHDSTWPSPPSVEKFHETTPL